MLGHEAPAGNCSLCTLVRGRQLEHPPHPDAPSLLMDAGVRSRGPRSKCLSQLSTNGACGVPGLAGMIGRAEPAAGSGWGRMQIVNGQPVYSATDLVGFL